jgi:hypothetical protein
MLNDALGCHGCSRLRRQVRRCEPKKQAYFCLFPPQNDQWVHARGATGWNVSCDERDGGD